MQPLEHRDDAGSRHLHVEHGVRVADVAGHRLVVVPHRPDPGPDARGSGRLEAHRGDRPPVAVVVVVDDEDLADAGSRIQRAIACAATPSWGLRRTSVSPRTPANVATGATARIPAAPSTGALASTWLEWKSPR
jgi:hypothetical protein